MADEIEQLWKNLKLTEEEEDGISVGDVQEQQSTVETNHWLIGKLLTNRPYNKGAMISTLKIIWKLAKEVTILILEENVLLFKFLSEGDKGRVLEGAPWSFDKHLLVLQDYRANLRPNEYHFDRSPFWIRIYDLPIGMRNAEMASMIGWKIGKLLAKDVSMESGEWASFLRIKVDIDITKPLRRYVKIASGANKSDIRARLSYERLPSFCYGCGLIGHNEVDCQRDDVGQGSANQYGSWLRASPAKRRPSATKIQKVILPPSTTNSEGRLPIPSCDRNQGGTSKGRTVIRKLGDDLDISFDPTVHNQYEGRNDEFGVTQGDASPMSGDMQKETKANNNSFPGENNGFFDDDIVNHDGQLLSHSTKPKETNPMQNLSFKARRQDTTVEVDFSNKVALADQSNETPPRMETQGDEANHNKQHNKSEGQTSKKG